MPLYNIPDALSSTTEKPDLDAALRDHPTDFPTRAAQVELGPAYARPELDSFVDRSPAQIALLRAATWSRA